MVFARFLRCGAEVLNWIYNFPKFFSRAEQILALTAAFDVYADVLVKADEGIKFYSTLFAIVRNLDEAIEGIESACRLCIIISIKLMKIMV